MNKKIALIICALCVVSFQLSPAAGTTNSVTTPNTAKVFYTPVANLPEFVKLPPMILPPKPPLTVEKFNQLRTNIKTDRCDPHRLDFWRWIEDYHKNSLCRGLLPEWF